MLAWRLLLACAVALAATGAAAQAAASAPLTTEYFDTARQRRIPVALYGARAGRPKPLAVISHGYGAPNTAYSFIAEALVARGYVVAAIQQDLPGDAAPASSGDLALLRRPIWQRGADSISYVIGELRARRLASRARVVAIGHSNGGDTVMLLASQQPALLRAVFSLDNRRMAMPRMSRPRICSVRSSDLQADPGVLPSAEEQRAHAMLIATIPGLVHNDMWDGATPAQKAAVLSHLFRCLSGRGR